ncbi:MAG TPA: phospholipase D-like domain-containing protein [Ktedonobacteraceae bacterium]|nr:phospholipase D-like domain-containing protein [Ktedonobacteraceae bacterium]
MSENALKEQVQARQKGPIVHRRPRISIRRIALHAFGIMVALQAITVAALRVVAIVYRRKRKNDQKPFPHRRFQPVHVDSNELQLYDYGCDLYEDMLAAIDSAKEYIYLETYIWKDDEIGRKFKEHLAKKAAEGVEVYVVFDWFGNLVVPRAFKSFPSSIHKMAYHPIKHPWQLFDPRRYALDHRKMLSVDGKIGFIGGFNLGSLYATEWRDTHLRITGPFAADLARAFIDFWNRSSPKGDTINRRMQRKFDPFISLRGNDAIRLTFPIRDMYIDAIDKAEHSIMLTNAYFVPDHILLGALKSAAARGVEVRILVPWVSNHIDVDWVARGYFHECLKAGIRIFGYQHMLHAKTCTIDGQWSTIGTANLDRLSSIGNFEINVEVYSAEFAQQMQELFECDLTDAEELTLDKWVHRHWYTKLSERILAPLRFMM